MTLVRKFALLPLRRRIHKLPPRLAKEAEGREANEVRGASGNFSRPMLRVEVIDLTEFVEHLLSWRRPTPAPSEGDAAADDDEGSDGDNAGGKEVREGRAAA